jgi:histidinol-phosphatase
MSGFLQVALDAARRAENEILKHFRAGIKPDFKPDGSPVTAADKEAEKTIKEVILNAFPEHGFMGEESGYVNQESPYVWIVDPIDETKNFVRGIPVFATLIGLMKDGEIIAGVSHAPALGETYSAEKGKGAFQNGKRLSVSTTASIDRAYVSFGGLKHFADDNRLPGFVSLVRNAHRPTGLPGFSACHLLADGRLDGVVQSSISIWDIAASKIIVEEAGGRMTDLDGKPVTLQTTTALATNGILHEQVLAHFRAQK